jgi:hypothetical protein
MTIKGWRERAGLPESYEVYGPSPVERAMLEEIAALQKRVERANDLLRRVRMNPENMTFESMLRAEVLHYCDQLLEE